MNEVQTVDAVPVERGGVAGMELWTAQNISRNLGMVQEAMEAVMKVGVDYGKIPGVDKPSLMQPGAQVLAQMFRLRAEVMREDVEQHDGGHRTYNFTTRLVHIPTGQVWGEGVGTCSTLETKYRYRSAPPKVTTTPVPKAYWDAKRAGDKAQMDALIGKGNRAVKGPDNNWYIGTPAGDKVENPDIAEVYNTVRKMAFKRSFVGNVLTVTGASRIFTQDVEEFMAAEFEEAVEVAEVRPRPAKDKPAADGVVGGRATAAAKPKPPAATPAAKPDDAATAQRALFAVAHELGLGVKQKVSGMGDDPVSVIYAAGIASGEAEDDKDIVAALRMIGAPLYEKDGLHFVVARELSPTQMRALAKELRDIKAARLATRDTAEMFGDPGPSDDDLHGEER